MRNVSMQTKPDFDDACSESGVMLDHDLAIPLVIDLDQTLLATDTFHESLLLFLRRRPAEAWKVPGWIFSGRAIVKHRVAEAVTDDDAAFFPARRELVALAEKEAARGRKIVLATAADYTIAERIQRRFPFIQELIATSEGQNLKAAAKAEAVAARFPDGFVYAGDSKADLPVWSRAIAAIFVGHSAALEREIRNRTSLAAVFPTKPAGFRTLRRGLRLHQWAKNALVFVPLVLGGKAHDPTAWLCALGGILALSMLASANYVLNDLSDLSEDRRHWSKKSRPIASGDLSVAFAISFAVSAGLCAFGIAALIGTACVFVLALYLGISLAYSVWLKRQPLVDIFVLASLFTIRLGLGVIVSHVVFSPWLFVFSMFIFLSLSAAKRQTEITRMVAHGLQETPGRGYRADDRELVLAVGVGAMLATILVMVIYLVEEAFPAGFYKQPYFLWGFPIVLFLWLARIWLLCHRGELYDDPVAFALKDKASLLYGGIMVALFVAALV